MRILTVTQRLSEWRGNDERCRQARRRSGHRVERLLKMRGDGCIVSRRASINFRSQNAPHIERRVAIRFDLLRHQNVIRRVHHHRHAVVILRRAAQHRRSADVYVLNRIV